MGFEPTARQKQAIYTIDRPVAVTAGAGSGKTRVLVERYLHLLDQGFTVDQIAAITFTKKAAQEMKERLRDKRPELTESLERAQISTVHSFCQRIIQEHPLQAKVDPRFRVAEEWEASVLLQEVIEEVVGPTEVPEELGSPWDTMELVFELYHKMLSKGDLNFRRPLESAADDFPLLQLKSEVQRVLTLPAGTDAQQRLLTELKAQWPELWEKLVLADDDLCLEALEILSSLLKGPRGKFREALAPLKDLIASFQQQIAEKKGRVVIQYLGEVLEQIHQLYSERKRLGGLLDFNDLERLSLELLGLPEVAADYPLAHLMVDEFQDTNPLQKQIVDAFVAQGATLFVVGDPKQSIYRFRGADVDVFVQTLEEMKRSGQDIFLDINFRSRPELLQFVNLLFGPLLEGESVGFEPSDPNPQKEPAGGPCVKILRIQADDLLADEAREREAQQIALRIRELVDGGRYKYQDINLLFRATTSVHIYEKALREAGIPYVNLGGRGFYSKQEIQDLLHYFRWLEDPGDKVAKAAVLRSPFYLVSDEGLYWIAQGRLDMLTPQDRGALHQAEEDAAELRELAKFRPAPEVITEILERTNYVEKTWRLPFGPQKVANLEKLLEQSWDLFARDLYSIPEQVRFLRLMAKEARKEGEAQLDAEHADVVILRTIHNSKGLEFPVVFLPDTNASVLRPVRGSVFYHRELGLTYRGMGSFEQAKELEKQAELSEAKRLLYVAVTRAKEELYWCARDGGQVNQESWWSWFQAQQAQIPAELYEEIRGDLPPFEAELELGEAGELILPRYEPVEPQYKQVSFSVTSLMNYTRCPRYYYLRYILALPERTRQKGAGQGAPSRLSATERGNIVHRVCEQIRDPKELGELITYAAEMEGVELEAEQKAQLEEIISSYLKSEFFRRVQGQDGANWTVYQERDFIIPAGSFLINGLVDQVFVGEQGVEVVDFKSNWIKQEQVAVVGASYQVQLRLYAWAMAREFGRPALSSQAYFLIPNELYRLDQELLDVERTEEWLVETCGQIIAGAQLGAEAFPEAGDCTLCPQFLYCQGGTEAAKLTAFGENTDIDWEWAEEELE